MKDKKDSNKKKYKRFYLYFDSDDLLQKDVIDFMCPIARVNKLSLFISAMMRDYIRKTLENKVSDYSSDDIITIVQKSMEKWHQKDIGMKEPEDEKPVIMIQQPAQFLQSTSPTSTDMQNIMNLIQNMSNQLAMVQSTQATPVKDNHDLKEAINSQKSNDTISDTNIQYEDENIEEEMLDEDDLDSSGISKEEIQNMIMSFNNQ